MKYFDWDMFFTFLLGITLGILLGVTIAKEKKVPEKASYTQIERDIDEATCQTKIINAIINERMRLTGQPNP